MNYADLLNNNSNNSKPKKKSSKVKKIFGGLALTAAIGRSEEHTSDLQSH